MIDLTELIRFVSPGSVKEVRRWNDAIDLWATIENSTNDMQTAIDLCVVWKGPLVTGQELFDAIPAFNAYQIAKENQIALNKKREIKVADIHAVAKTKIEIIEPGIDLDKDFYVLKLIITGITVTPGSDLERVKNLGAYAKQRIAWANDTATEAELDAYNATTDPGWPE